VAIVTHGKGREGGRGGGLAETARVLRALDEMYVDRERLIDAKNAIIVEIALLHLPSVDGDLIIQRTVRPKIMPPSICARTESGLIACPQSIAIVTLRRRITLPLATTTSHIADKYDPNAD
jgi:hypothetical protein